MNYQNITAEQLTNLIRNNMSLYEDLYNFLKDLHQDIVSKKKLHFVNDYQCLDYIRFIKVPTRKYGQVILRDVYFHKARIEFSYIVNNVCMDGILLMISFDMEQCIKDVVDAFFSYRYNNYVKEYSRLYDSLINGTIYALMKYLKHNIDADQQERILTEVDRNILPIVGKENIYSMRYFFTNEMLNDIE